MKFVIKNISPLAFEEWKKQEKPTNWNILLSSPIKDENRKNGIKYYSKYELRDNLLLEQGFICCYCNMRIYNDPNTTVVEHILPKEGINNQNLIFDYNNLAASCNGGEKDPKPRKLHCDSNKNKTVISLTHLNPACESLIVFNLSGKISGLSESALSTINILNLNIPKLDNQREQAIIAYLYNDEQAIELISINDASKLLINIQEKNLQGEYIPYVSAIICMLKTIME